MYNDIIASHHEAFEAAVAHFVREAAKIRTGRATPALVEDVFVDYYGTRTPMKAMANISIPEARQILIQPWDSGALVGIVSAINDAQLGVNPQSDGTSVRITLPALNEEQRREFVKVLGRKAEEARVSVRQVREEAQKEIQEAEKEGLIGEDDKFAAKEALQKVVDTYNARIEELRDKKEKEIMTV